MIVYEIGIPYSDKQYQAIELLFLQNTCNKMCIPMSWIVEKPKNFIFQKALVELEFNLKNFRSLKLSSYKKNFFFFSPNSLVLIMSCAPFQPLANQSG